MRYNGNMQIDTERLMIRHFKDQDIEALFDLLKDEEVNIYLPWFPLKSLAETRTFYEKRLKDRRYSFAICLKEQDRVIGYVCVSEDESHDFGYALNKNYWHKGIMTEACKAIVEYLKDDGIPYITATHDLNNIRSGKVMRNIGMKYHYAYKERWMPKDIDVIFCFYQMNFDGSDYVYRQYLTMYPEVVIEDEHKRLKGESDDQSGVF